MQNSAQSDEATAKLAVAIGARIRQERQARHWTLDHLARIAGVSRRMLVNVEQGAANPSVGTLLKFSDALGIGLPALVEPPRSNRVKIVHQGEGAVLWSSEDGGRGVLVAGTSPPDVVELWDWILAPGDQHRSDAHATGTEELVQIIEGTLSIQIGNESITLNTGDAASFPGDEPHAYDNPGTQPARFSLVVFEPGVGAGARLEVSRDESR